MEGKEKKVDERERVFQEVIKRIRKEHGSGAVMRLGDRQVSEKVEVIPTGSLSLDIALGVGGFPRGRIVEIYGPEMSGKTTIALMAIAEAQRAGGKAVFIDAEHALDPEYASALGVNVDELWVSQPDYGEQALAIMHDFVRSGAVDVVVLDSVAALVPKAEIKGEMEDVKVGDQARLMSKAMRMLAGAIAKSKTLAVFINQLRMKIGDMYNPWTTTGGVALKFYASVRLEVRRGQLIKDGDETVGHVLHFQVTKNKLAPPFKKGSIHLIYGKGIDKLGELVDLALKFGILTRAGSWISYEEKTLAQGRDNVAKLLAEKPELAQELREKILQKAGLK